MSTTLTQLKRALDAETNGQGIPDLWTPSGSGFGLLHRAVQGLSFIELDYDYPAKLDSHPRWVAIIWRTVEAYERDVDGGRLAILYCEAPSPSGLSPEGFARIARFAAGAVRLGAAIELTSEGQ